MSKHVAKDGEVTGATLTDEQIRKVCRAQPEILDTLMVAIHSTDRELRAMARAYCATAHNARFHAPTLPEAARNGSKP